MVTINIRHYCGVSPWYNRNIEVLACKIAQHKDEKIILDLETEGFDIVANGIEQIVKNIADELDISYSQIQFTSSDRLCNSKIFKHTIKLEDVSYDALPFQSRKIGNHTRHYKEITLPTAFNYGLFLGRADNERLYSFWKHKNWNYSSRGKASMHLDINTVSEWDSEFTGFICEHNEKWKSLVPLLPYSDVGSYLKPPIIIHQEHNFDINVSFWDNVYSDLAIEIVCETNVTPNNFFITEKTFRPIAHGKLFLVIGSPEFEQNLKSMGFDIFDDIIDKQYDTESSYIRADAVFKSLGGLLSNPIDMNTLLPRLKANKRVLETL